MNVLSPYCSISLFIHQSFSLSNMSFKCIQIKILIIYTQYDKMLVISPCKTILSKWCAHETFGFVVHAAFHILIFTHALTHEYLHMMMINCTACKIKTFKVALTIIDNWLATIHLPAGIQELYLTYKYTHTLCKIIHHELHCGKTGLIACV